MRTIAKSVLLLLWVTGWAVAAERPNIVLILSDDLGYGSLGCYGADPKLIRTPACDRLAAEGRRFTDANSTSSVCSPTRYSVLTGRYCWRTALKREVLNTWAPLHIETTRLTLGSMLKQHGYDTAAVGKWHLGYQSGVEKADFTKELKPGPLEIGFDYHFGVPSNHGDVSGVFVENHWVLGLDKANPNKPTEAKNFRGSNYFPLNAPKRDDPTVMRVLTDKAIDWMKQPRQRRPFFLYFTPVAVHNPVTPGASTRGSSAAGPFGDWVHELDLCVDRVLKALDEIGAAENTLVVFTSDNGGVNETRADTEQTRALLAGLKPVGAWRGGKHHVYEGGFRVPFLARWPGRIPAGSVSDQTISLVDLMATIAAIVGHELPAPASAAEDSYNILPALTGAVIDRPLRPAMIVHSADGVFALRQGPWKWIEGKPYQGPDELNKTPKGTPKMINPPKSRAEEYHEQLYNLQSDPAETQDMLKSNPKQAAELRALLEQWRRQGHSR